MYSYDDRMRAVKLYIQYARHPASSTTNDERLTTNDEPEKKPPPEGDGCPFSIWSGRQDSNLRPLSPEPSALPNCATPRQRM